MTAGPVGCSWSGGKDSCFALMKAMELGATPKLLLNMMNENGKISRSHGLPYAILKQQADQMELPLLAVATSWADYEMHFVNSLHEIKKNYGTTAIVFGDIDLEDHRAWEEKVCNKAEMTAILPIWQRDRKQLVLEMLSSGIKTMIVSCNTTMGEGFLGKTLNIELVSLIIGLAA